LAPAIPTPRDWHEASDLPLPRELLRVGWVLASGSALGLGRSCGFRGGLRPDLAKIRLELR